MCPTAVSEDGEAQPAPHSFGSVIGYFGSVTDVRVGDLMVVRFAPYQAETLLRRAERDYQRSIDEGRTPFYSVSVFALERQNEQTTIDDLITLICETAPVTGKKCAVTTRRHLEAEGFRVERSEPPQHHHDVYLGNELREMDVKRLAAIFEPGIRRNPAWK